MTFVSLGIHQERVPTPRRSEYQTTRITEPYCYGADRGLQLMIRVYLLICATATVLRHPWLGPKERASTSMCVFDWLPIE